MDTTGKAARDYAMTLLSGRAYTEKGLYDKLVRRYGDEAAGAAVTRMLELGLLDDEAYAERFASVCVDTKGFSPRRTAMELARKGIDRDIIEAVINGFDNDQRPAIARVVTRKYLRLLDDEKGRRKTINALLRLGYAYNDIAEVLRNLDGDEQYYEECELADE